MSLLFPLGLAALASLLAPLLIHLARRTEQRPTDFAALRWLRQKPRPRHRPRFDERLLLVVRLLLLAGIAMVLAQPVITGERAAERVIAVAPGAALPAPSDARRIWLAPSFPAIDTPMPTATIPIGSLIRQLDADLPPDTTLTVVVPRILDGADAERPRVSRPITWRIAGEGRAAAPPTSAVAATLRYDPALPGIRYITAAASALGWSAQPIDAGTGGQTGKDLIWLATGPLPPAISAYVSAGHDLLVSSSTTVPAGPATAVWRDASGAALVDSRPLGRGRILRFARALTPAAMPQLLEPAFPRRLAALLAAPPPPTRVPATDYTPQMGASAPTPPTRALWPWFALAVAGLFAIERWLATRANRRAAP